jgi:hypothetical protein
MGERLADGIAEASCASDAPSGTPLIIKVANNNALTSLAMIKVDFREELVFIDFS